jgi:hypothetical protein
VHLPSRMVVPRASFGPTNKTDLRVLPPSFRFCVTSLYTSGHDQADGVRETTLARPDSKHGVAPALIHKVCEVWNSRKWFAKKS